ncbi:ferritin-like domain-containing protein [Halodesulfovibrio marinisediminis]|uniref:Rubrerythrin n=1 Tax=Halodesulfovibrio marinisediminis DSM 17456 TaxID=1121457 RepID=A0A1N6DJG4_9BACT|nr:ferritin family protein [Halodesulfovibrio marinisediminis]SIN70804.1 Rubrerythrin [Halodesulfovibrio marinisediminis DSM 17456]
MASFFRANEIAKFAVEIEKKGREFYLRLEKAAQTPETCELFHYLAVEETKHQKIFQSLQDRLGEIELPAWATNEEYGSYIQGLIESHALFSDQAVERRMAAMEDEKEAIRMAMSFEKDSILFFVEMESFVPDSEKEAVRECIQEERLHLIRLQNMYTKL